VQPVLGHPALPRATKLALGATDDAAFAALARRCLETDKTS